MTVNLRQKILLCDYYSVHYSSE